jgi:hypothetical protein
MMSFYWCFWNFSENLRMGAVWILFGSCEMGGLDDGLYLDLLDLA